MEITQAHHDDINDTGHTYFGEHPNPRVQEFADNMSQEMQERVRRYQEFVDTAPNRNEAYAHELRSTQAYFAEAGLTIAPIVVLDPKSFAIAYALSGNSHDGQPVAGMSLFGRIIVCDQSRVARRIYGKAPVFGTMLHEAAHSTAQDEKVFITSKGVLASSAGNVAVNNRIFSATFAGGLDKVRGQGEQAVTDGAYLEEGFADLTRVRGQARFGRESRIDNKTLFNPSLGVRYLGEGVERPLLDRDGTLNIPVKFGTVRRRFGGLVMACRADTVGDMASYGLDLLDKEVRLGLSDEEAPGLYDTILASRTDPTQQREVIKMINSIRPGLYRELRTLPYTAAGFRHGLLTIHAAIEARHRASPGGTSNGTPHHVGSHQVRQNPDPVGGSAARTMWVLPALPMLTTWCLRVCRHWIRLMVRHRRHGNRNVLPAEEALED